MTCHPILPLSTLHSPRARIHFYLFLLSSVAVPVHDGLRCTSTSSLCFPWKAGVKLSSPSCSHQCRALREFPINSTGTTAFTSKAAETLGTNHGGALPRAPSLTPTLCIGYHSTATQRTFSQGPGFPGSLEELDLYKESVGPLVIAWGSLSDVCFIWKVIDSVPDRKPVIFVWRLRSA